MHAWLMRFFDEHRVRHPDRSLPETGDKAGVSLYEIIGEEMTKLRLDYDAATAASRKLVIEPASPRDKHWSKFFELAREEMNHRPVGTAGHRVDISTREGAEAASKSCDRCGGAGLTTVWHPSPDYARRIPRTVAAYCVCAYGRWVKGNHAVRCPDVAKRTPDLAEVLERRSVWMAEQPKEDSHG